MSQCVCFFFKECERKQTDYTAKAEELRKKYDATCKQMGIEVDSTHLLS